jgi:transposase
MLSFDEWFESVQRAPDKTNITLSIIRRDVHGRGFEVLPRRWVVEAASVAAIAENAGDGGAARTRAVPPDM